MSRIPRKSWQKNNHLSHTVLTASWSSPIQLMRDLDLPGNGSHILLDSAGGDPELCRFSMLAWDPRLEVCVRAGRVELTDFEATDNAAGERHVFDTTDPFSLLRELLRELEPEGSAAAAASTGLPFAGGAVGMVGYDAGRYIERLPNQTTDDLEIPDLHFLFPRKLVAYDHLRGVAHLLFEDPGPGELEQARGALVKQEAAARLQADASGGRHELALSSTTKSNTTPESFKRMVRQAKEYILAGDIFQSNLSQRLESRYEGDSLALYDALRTVNPSPFAGYLDMGDYQVISSSPERLIHLQGQSAQTRPIAGTRRRGIDISEDDSLTQELNLDPKERAEHIMLVDLERNDMGRVCDYGSVRVDELMVNEAYSHVIHIVSNVRGELHEARDALDLLKAMFPGGTITGCPKVRCMEIIDELEPVRRGAYTGSFGYIGYNGNMDMNIIIRTLVRKASSIYVQVGAGIVADSDPDREYDETLRKAEAMMRAVELAESNNLIRQVEK